MLKTHFPHQQDPVSYFYFSKFQYYYFSKFSQIFITKGSSIQSVHNEVSVNYERKRFYHHLIRLLI